MCDNIKNTFPPPPSSPLRTLSFFFPVAVTTTPPSSSYSYTYSTTSFSFLPFFFFLSYPRVQAMTKLRKSVSRGINEITCEVPKGETKKNPPPAGKHPNRTFFLDLDATAAVPTVVVCSTVSVVLDFFFFLSFFLLCNR